MIFSSWKFYNTFSLSISFLFDFFPEFIVLVFWVECVWSYSFFFFFLHKYKAEINKTMHLTKAMGRVSYSLEKMPFVHCIDRYGNPGLLALLNVNEYILDILTWTRHISHVGNISIIVCNWFICLFVYSSILQYRKDCSSQVITMKHELLAQSLVKNLTASFEQRS